MDDIWGIKLETPISGRPEKPRSTGLTMVLDKGLSLNELNGLLETGSSYIDFIKFSFGTSFLYSERVLASKIKLIKTYGVDVYPGGTLFEIAVSQGKMNDFLYRARRLGFTAVEISSGIIDFSLEIKKQAVYAARDLGFTILTEVGKKDRNKSLTVEKMKRLIEEDMELKADIIIIEGRESGCGISIYNSDGSIDLRKFRYLNSFMNEMPEVKDKILWEAPLKKQQIFYIKEFGPAVNLGNIASNEVLALECLRCGLRGDTFVLTLENTAVEKGDTRTYGGYNDAKNINNSNSCRFKEG